MAYLPPDRALAAALLCGFAAASGLVTIDAVAGAIAKRTVARVAADHVRTALDAYGFILEEMRRLAPAEHVMA